MLRHVIGNAMHPRRPVANPRQNVGDGIGQLSGRVHGAAFPNVAFFAENPCP
jgi:hypothetical protein